MTPTDPLRASPPAPTFREALQVWIKVALLSFGGPAGQIAVMHRLVVEEKKCPFHNRRRRSRRVAWRAAAPRNISAA